MDLVALKRFTGILCLCAPVNSGGRGGGVVHIHESTYVLARAREQGREGETRRGRIETALEWNISLSFLSRLNLKAIEGLNTITDPSAARSEGKLPSVKLERLIDFIYSLYLFIYYSLFKICENFFYITLSVAIFFMVLTLILFFFFF